MLIEIATYSVELIKSKRCDNDAGRYGVDTCPTLTPLDGFSHYALHVTTLSQLIGMERIMNITRLQKFKTQ